MKRCTVFACDRRIDQGRRPTFRMRDNRGNIPIFEAMASARAAGARDCSWRLSELYFRWYFGRHE